MISIKKKHPLDNLMCRVKTREYMKEFPEAFRYVRSSDGEWHWDNLVDDILQSSEVTHWEPYNEENK